MDADWTATADELRALLTHGIGPSTVSCMKVDLDNLKCRDCGIPIPNPGYRLSQRQAANRQCPACYAEGKRQVGRRPMERNASIGVSPEMEQVILGSVLGDGHLEVPPPGSLNWGLSIKHSLVQETYALHKASLLGPLVSKVDYPKDRVRVRTVRHPFLTALAKEVVVNGVKTVPLSMLNRVGPLALAIWYMDDGSLHVRVNKSGKRHRLIRICSFSFTQEENLWLRLMLKGFGLQPIEWRERCRTGKKDFYYGVRLSGVWADKFLDITQPHAAPGMSHKWA